MKTPTKGTLCQTRWQPRPVTRIAGVEWTGCYLIIPKPESELREGHVSWRTDGQHSPKHGCEISTWVAQQLIVAGGVKTAEGPEDHVMWCKHDNESISPLQHNIATKSFVRFDKTVVIWVLSAVSALNPILNGWEFYATVPKHFKIAQRFCWVYRSVLIRIFYFFNCFT